MMPVMGREELQVRLHWRYVDALMCWSLLLSGTNSKACVVYQNVPISHSFSSQAVNLLYR